VSECMEERKLHILGVGWAIGAIRERKSIFGVIRLSCKKRMHCGKPLKKMFIYMSGQKN